MATKVFKTDAAYQPSITFYDNYQRKDGYLANSSARVQIPDRLYNYSAFTSSIGWTLDNTNALAEIPEWAFYYSVNISKCLRTRFFLQLRGLDATYVKKDNDGNFVFNNPDYSPALAGCAFDISTLVPFNMGYVFAQGDLVKIYIGTDVFTLIIIGQEGNWIITELQDVGSLNGGTAFLFEIYTPYKPATSEPSYEVSQIFPVLNPGTSLRTYSTIAGNIAGDVYLVNRAGPNRNVYAITAGTITGVGDHTLGVNYVSQDATDPNYTTGNSPRQSLAGFNPATNNDRWLINDTNPLTFRVSGTVIVSTTATNYRIDLLDNNGNIWTVIPAQTVVPNQVYTFAFSIDIPLIAGSKLFIWALETAGSNTTYQASTLVITALDSVATYTVEAMSPNDKFYQNWWTDAGRVNNIDTIGQVTKTNSIAYSNTLVAGSKINGLSTYDALDEGAAVIPQECGPIRKLQLTSKVADQGPGNVMLGICSRETASMYLGEVQVTASSQNAFLSSAPGVIGTINVLKGSFGTRNPESVQEFKGNVFWLDANNGKYIQYGPNGLFPISHYKMTKYWKLFSEAYLTASRTQIEDWGCRPFVFTGIDPHNGELLVSVPRVLQDPPKGYLPGDAAQFEVGGLNGDYYNTVDLTGPIILSRIDPTINLVCPVSCSPAPGINNELFSVRWTGRIFAQYSETYTFYTNSDDGVRLWINNVLIIDNWTVHSPVEDTGTIALVAGQTYDIRLEFFNNTMAWEIILSWSSNSIAKEIIPANRLYAQAPVPYPFDIWDGRAKSLVYKLYEEPNYWQGAYNIPAENFIYAGNMLFAFKNGKLYQLNSETENGNFFEVRYQPRVMFVENQAPALPKVWNNVALVASKIPELIYFRTEDPYIQASDLKDFDPWNDTEGVFYCYIYNDKLTPSPTGLMPNGLILGDKMRAKVLFVMLRWDAPATFQFVNIGFSKSLGHSI